MSALIVKQAASWSCPVCEYVGQRAAVSQHRARKHPTGPLVARRRSSLRANPVIHENDPRCENTAGRHNKTN